MEATPPVTRLVSVAKGVADAVQQRPGGEATLEDTRPIEQVRYVAESACGGQCGVGWGSGLTAVCCASRCQGFLWGRRGSVCIIA